MKKDKNWFLRIITILFIIFVGIYIASISGYYESKVNKKVAITDEALKEFEKDVLSGNYVDVKKYLNTETTDYSNAFTNAGEKVGESVIVVINDGLSGIWDALKVLFF